MQYKDALIQKTLRKKYKNIITMGLKDTWSEITENQRLD